MKNFKLRTGTSYQKAIMIPISLILLSSCGQKDPNENDLIFKELGLTDVTPDNSMIGERPIVDDKVPIPTFGESVINEAIEYVDKFFNDNYRKEFSSFFELGQQRFFNHYKKSKSLFKGYVLGAPGEHELTGTDCTRFIASVWNRSIKKKHGPDKKEVPYLPTMYLYDIVWAYENAPDIEQAYDYYEYRVKLKMKIMNSELKSKGQLQLGSKWLTKQLSYFGDFDYIGNLDDASIGDYVLVILNTKKQYFERGHAYLFTGFGGERAGIGAQNYEKGLAYNYHFNNRTHYVLRPKVQ